MYWNAELNEPYIGDKINWFDVSLISERPSNLHTPVIVDGQHTGDWSETLTPIAVDVVSRAQGKTALIQAGYWASVVAFVDAIPDPTTKALAEVALYDTTNWQRNSPFLSTAAESLDISASELDQLFLVASQIQL